MLAVIADITPDMTTYTVADTQFSAIDLCCAHCINYCACHSRASVPLHASGRMSSNPDTLQRIPLHCCLEPVEGRQGLRPSQSAISPSVFRLTVMFQLE